MNKEICAFANIFGKPKEGIHKYRIFGLAGVDVFFTILAAVFIWWIWGDYSLLFLCKTLLGLFLVSILCHRFFCVRTTIDRFLFP